MLKEANSNQIARSSQKHIVFIFTDTLNVPVEFLLNFGKGCPSGTSTMGEGVLVSYRYPDQVLFMEVIT